MKKILTVILIVITIIAAVMFFLVQRENQNTILYTVQNKQYRLFTAKTPQEWEKGLMFVRKLDNADGMIFLFPDKNTRTFWNKNTYVDLDLYWMDDMIVVGKSYLPSVEKKGIVTVTSPRPVNMVVELIRK